MPPSGLIPVAEALDNLFALVDPVDVEWVPLDKAAGRVLARYDIVHVGPAPATHSTLRCLKAGGGVESADNYHSSKIMFPAFTGGQASHQTLIDVPRASSPLLPCTWVARAGRGAWCAAVRRIGQAPRAPAAELRGAARLL